MFTLIVDRYCTYRPCYLHIKSGTKQEHWGVYPETRARFVSIYK